MHWINKYKQNYSVLERYKANPEEGFVKPFGRSLVKKMFWSSIFFLVMVTAALVSTPDLMAGLTEDFGTLGALLALLQGAVIAGFNIGFPLFLLHTILDISIDMWATEMGIKPEKNPLTEDEDEETN